MKKITGIDFGMQNLKVCHFDGNKLWKVDLEGNPQNSSKASVNAVFYCENEEKQLTQFFFGSQEAENARKFHNPDYVRFIKRQLQKESYIRTFCKGKYRFSATDIITDIFQQVSLKMNESRLDVTAPVILTVPVVFSEAQKAKLKYCAEKAGFSVQEVITEPFAALFSESFYDECIDTEEDEANYILLDFGASTMDICLFRIQNGGHTVVEVLASTGISSGGKDITDLLVPFLEEKLQPVIAKVVQTGRLEENSVKAEIFELAEKLKNKLYEEEETPEISEPFYGDKAVLKQVNVNKLIEKSGIWEKIETAIEEMFDSLDEPVDYSDISKLIMTGGTSKIEYFRQKAQKLFSDAELVGDVEDEEAIYCAVSSGSVNYAKNETIEILNSSAMCIGIDLGKGFERALNRNSFYGMRGRRIALIKSVLEQNNWKIKVYQTLKDVRNHAETNTKDMYYAGYVQLNPNFYENNTIYLRLYCMPDGICAETASEENINQLIETSLTLKVEVISYE